MKQSKKKTPFIVVAIVVAVIAIFGIVWYFSTTKLKESDTVKEFVDVLQTTSSTAKEDNDDSWEISNVPSDNEFDFVNVEDYQEDINRIMLLIDCEYKGTYDWGAFLNESQSEKVRSIIWDNFNADSEIFDITPDMTEIFKNMRETIMYEAANYFDSEVDWEDWSPDGDGDSNSDVWNTKLTEENLTYPLHYYDCMKKDNGYLASEMDIELLRNTILSEKPELFYNSDTKKWTVKRLNEKDDVYVFDHKVITLANTLEQMVDKTKYHFIVSNLRKCDNYYILSLFRGQQYLDVKYLKNGDKYMIVNINDLISALINVPE